MEKKRAKRAAADKAPSPNNLGLCESRPANAAKRNAFSLFIDFSVFLHDFLLLNVAFL
jgi:hypothetical protein